MRSALAAFLAALGYAERSVTLLVADDAELRRLNREYRGQDRPTDVLSWSYEETEGDSGGVLGELAISLERARAQAAANGWALRTELLRLLAHGCAHLVGYDHLTPEQDRDMKAVEVRLLDGVGLAGLYPED